MMVLNDIQSILNDIESIRKDLNIWYLDVYLNNQEHSKMNLLN
jgi:hypothetical protein